MDGSAFAAPAITDFDGLLANLDRQSSLYDTLLQLSDRERVAIAEANLPQLAEVIAAKETVIAEAQLLERQRTDACLRWARARGQERAPTLEELRVWVDSEVLRARLDEVRVSLSQRVQRLRQANGRNQHIIMQTQRMQENVLAAALKHARHPVYNPQGDTAPDQRPSIIFDYRV